MKDKLEVDFGMGWLATLLFAAVLIPTCSDEGFACYGTAVRQAVDGYHNPPTKGEGRNGE